MRIFCDLDDVLWEFFPCWCSYYNLKTNENIKPEDFKEWDINKCDKIKYKDKFNEILHQDDLWDYVYHNQDKDKIGENYKWLKKLNDHKEIDLYITTATFYRNTNKLDLFLQYFDFIDPKQLILIRDKWILDGEVIIDDNEEVIYQCQQKFMKTYKINKPWNGNFTPTGVDSFVHAAEDILKRLEK